MNIQRYTAGPLLGFEQRTYPTGPLLEPEQRTYPTFAVKLLTAIPRALLWCVGAMLSSLVAGFTQGWRDAE